MATTNIWQKFKSLIPEGSKTVVTVTANNGNGTSQVKLRNGSVITAWGESVSVGQKAIIQNGEVKNTAPDLPQYEADV